MTYDSTSTGDDQVRSSVSGGIKSNGSVTDLVESIHLEGDTGITNHHSHENEIIDPMNASSHNHGPSSSIPLPNNSNNNNNNNNVIDEHHAATSSDSNFEGSEAICYNKVLDDQIRFRLDKLNALSDLINSLERQFDEANSSFRETLKCSTDRLSSIAKALGHKSIRHARIYHAAKISVEQTQSDCQKACVQFEQANKDHQFAKKAIKDAELRLREVAEQTTNGVIAIPNIDLDSIGIDLCKLKLAEDLEGKKDGGAIEHQLNEHSESSCDKETNSSFPTAFELTQESKISKVHADQVDTSSSDSTASSVGMSTAQVTNFAQSYKKGDEKATYLISNAAKLSEELNQAILKLIEAETKRGQSERQHLDRASKLMIAQENLMKLEREYGPSIRRSQLYFDESRRFNAKLKSVKGEICRISEEILAAKQAYAQTLSELEQFSDKIHDLHGDSNVIVAKREP